MAASVPVRHPWAHYRLALWRPDGAPLDSDRIGWPCYASKAEGSGRGQEEENAARAAREGFNAVAKALEEARRRSRDQARHFLQWKTSKEAQARMELRSEGSEAQGSVAAHPEAHPGDLANAAESGPVGGRGPSGDVSGDTDAGVRTSSSGLSGKGGGGLMFWFILCRNCARVVGAAGFEPATPSSRTRKSTAKILKYLNRRMRTDANNAGT